MPGDALGMVGTVHRKQYFHDWSFITWEWAKFNAFGGIAAPAVAPARLFRADRLLLQSADKNERSGRWHLRFEPWRPALLPDLCWCLQHCC
jgi:hypothetical protein